MEMFEFWIRIHRNICFFGCNCLRANSQPWPRQNGRLFADDTFKRIFLNENIRISTKNSLKFVSKGLINNIPALVLIMAWRRPGDKPLSESMLVRSLTHICVTRPQWVKSTMLSESLPHLPGANELILMICYLAACRKQCNPLGTRKVPNPGGVLCNRRTGDCPCVNNKTIGPECGQCIPQYFWHTKVGCEACGCHDGRHTGLCHIGEQGKTIELTVNPLRAKFFTGNINIYIHFVSFIHINMTQVLKILPQVREGPTYSI